MMKMQVVGFMVVIYFTIVLGVFIKAKVKKAKNITLFDCSIVPILIIIVMCLAIIEELKDSELSIIKRLFKTFEVVRVTLIGFPILVTGTIYTLSNNSVTKVNRKSTNLINLINCIIKEQDSTLSFQ